jgi:hypothetical protein
MQNACARITNAGAAQDDASEIKGVSFCGVGKNGHKGLDLRLCQGKQMHTIPRFYSYNVLINKIVCGLVHSSFIACK